MLQKRVIVALDVDSLERAGSLIKMLASHVAYFKVGLELITSVGGPQAVRFVQERDGKVFYDGKFKDTPNTVAAASKAVALMGGVQMFSIHCSGGKKMMEAAVKSLRKINKQALILGVTLLTSLNYDDLVELGICEELNIANPEELKQIQRERIERFAVRHLAWLAQETGLDGIIASPHEIKAIRKYCQPELLVVTPGIRPEWAPANDQKRMMTPKEAIELGADYLVIGEPITKPPANIGGPVEAIKLINQEVLNALKQKEEKSA